MLDLPFVTFDWVAAWWQCLRSDRFMVRDELFFVVFRDQAGSLRGVAPLMLTSRPARGPLRMRQLQCVGADTNLTELRCVAAHRSDLDAIHLALIDYLRGLQLPLDWIKFTGIGSSAVLEHITRKFGVPRWSRAIPDFVITLKATWEEFRGGLPRNIKESLRKCYNAPRRDGVEFEFVRVSQTGELQAAIPDVLRLHAARSELAGTVDHPNVFRSEASQRFLREVCRRFALRDRLRIYQLRRDGVVVATRVGFVCNDSLYLFYSGYDPAYARYSVMTRVVAEAIQDAIASGLKTVNLSVGRDISKERWHPQELTYHEIDVTAPCHWSRMMYQLYRIASVCLRK
ncbi:MAG: GNAT family N-acetyltransferase [Steroidobacteraceae bacterium]